LFYKYADNNKAPFGNANAAGRWLVYSIVSMPVILKKRIHFSNGDVLILPEHFTVMAFPGILRKLHDVGVRIGFICHDLLTVRYPQYYPKEDAVNFESHLRTTLEFSTFCIANSEYTKNDLKKYISETDIGTNVRLESFKLGYDLDSTNYDGYVRPEILTVFKKLFPTYLAVSTIEPRKNYEYILNSFDQLWQNNPDINLIIIGKVGWMCGHIVERILTHPLFNKRLFMFNDASDTELDFCYNRSKALVAASINEGFGLPIIEALSHGIYVLASGIPVFREVGKDFCSYFDINDPLGLSKEINRWEKTGIPPVVRRIKEFKWPNWKESTEELIDKILLCVDNQ
jgi:alpha-1,2-rhamnosyltransferase